MADIVTFQGWENWDGALLLQAYLGTITYKVFRTDTNAQTGTGSLTVSAVVFDTAQTNSGWPYSDGFNFKFLLPASCFPVGGIAYRVEFIVTPTGLEPFPIVFRAFAQNLLTS